MIVVDTHAHLYPCYDVGRFLATARRNLSRIGARATSGRAACAHVLCLAERPTENAFADLADARLTPRGWRLVRCAEDAALKLLAEDAFELFVVAGRQIVTRERLELLALGIAAGLPAGEALDKTLASVRRLRAVPVLPWSPGKWAGQRGRELRALIQTAAAGDFLLGDTALRPCPGTVPPLFALARARGLPLLAGSDPLPLAGDERHVGRYVTVVDAPFSAETPFASLRAALCADGPAPLAHGRRRGWPSVALALARHALARE